MRNLRFAVLVNPGVGEIFLQTLADYGLVPLSVVTDHPAHPTSGSGIRPQLRDVLIRASPALPSSLVPPGFGTYKTARRLGWPVIAKAHLLRDRTLDLLADLDLDFIFVFSFDLLPPEVLRLAKRGCWSFHPSLLPMHRGPSPIHWIKQQGQTKTGFTILQLDEGIDTGPILLQHRVETSVEEDADHLMWRLCSLGARAFTRLIVATHYQDPPEAIQQAGPSSYQKRPSRESATISSSMALAHLSQTVRAWRARGGARVATPSGLRTVLDVVLLDEDAPSDHHQDRAALRTTDGHTVLLILEAR